ncbi:hypothetical protein I3760_02G004400 [Carya illinoinensis]|nr:hypothetical protein I3760_02G004400 [Carya illinoinensis]
MGAAASCGVQRERSMECISIVLDRIDTLELKTWIERSLGHQKAEEYFDLLKRFLSLKISKSNFDKLCINKIGRENVYLHNHLIRSIISNACLSKIPPSKDHRTPSIHDRKFSDHLSLLGPYGKNHSVACEESLIPKFQEKQSTIEMFSFSSRPCGSIEDGEETKRMRNVLCSGSMTANFTRTCQNGGDILDTSSLRKKLEQKWETEGVKISVDCANLLNNGLDVYLKRLIKPCLDLAGSRSIHKHIDQRCSCAIPGLMDFRVSMELNPLILGADWPIELEKVCLCASEN